ncbi:hypothetical protein SAMN05444409_2300 [Epilithonimonas zeae]|uniref:Uncharacterized protein n=1 Tax=Epilithonimonas zeae TaxID=1416779 RepID=A0A1N6H7F1_9FLAO|nr:hypothetical protein SAMN05444409_2300 [Epilithonimonas zeae]
MSGSVKLNKKEPTAESASSSNHNVFLARYCDVEKSNYMKKLLD